jgi:hypothetical protein
VSHGLHSSLSKQLGLPGALGFVGLVAVALAAAAGCGGSNGAPADAGGDITHRGGEVIVDAGGGDGEAGIPADGTTGKPCQTDADCAGPNGPGINKCSSSLVYSVTTVPVVLLPTSVCKVPPSSVGGNCDPAPPGDPTGQSLHYCDGPDDPSAPGICVPLTSPATPGQGTCEIPCTFAFDGSAPSGCIGKNTCLPIPGIVASGPTGAIVGGVGYCNGSCEKDSDCSGLGTGWVCQTDIGYCTQHPLATRKKAFGATCTTAGRVNDVTTGACNCGIVSSATGTGLCAPNCIVGGTVPCPTGWVCDNLQDPMLTTVENVQTQGVCLPVCTLADAGAREAAAPDASGAADGAIDDGSADAIAPGDGGAAGEAAAPASCPTGSTCQLQTPLGPECLP